MVSGLETIREIAGHVGQHVIVGYDRYRLPERDSYTRMLAAYGLPFPAADSRELHDLSSAGRVCTRIRGRVDAVGVSSARPAWHEPLLPPPVHARARHAAGAAPAQVMAVPRSSRRD